MSLMSRSMRAVGLLVQYGCLAHCTLEFVGDLVVCDGPSMEPTIHNRDVVISERLSVRSRVIPRDSVIIVRSPSEPRSFLCKRLVAGPGERVPVPGSLTFVPKGHVWLKGDNEGNSTDSRSFGPVPFGLVRGRVVFRVWPPEAFGPVSAVEKT